MNTEEIDINLTNKNTTNKKKGRPSLTEEQKQENKIKKESKVKKEAGRPKKYNNEDECKEAQKKAGHERYQLKRLKTIIDTIDEMLANLPKDKHDYYVNYTSDVLGKYIHIGRVQIR